MLSVFNLNIVKQSVILGLVILLAWQLANSVWLFFPLESAVSSNNNSVTSSDKINNPPQLNINHIMALNLFGMPEQLGKITGQEKRQINAPETSLNLKLRGLRKGQGTIKSSAIIENKQGEQEIYYLGDEIHGHSQVKIYEIYSQHLILERAGKYETLTLFDVLQQKKSNQVEGEQGIKSTALKVPVIDKTKNRDLTRRLSEIADIIKARPLTLSGRIIIQPLEDENGFQGYKVSPGSDKLLFARLGFLKDDVITQVNDIELDGADKVIPLVGVLSSVEELEIKVTRRGQPLVFKYRVK